ncbi:MAG: phosphatidylserine decarboxylase [Proteobacteria bacterium]|nr:phosphatidylserine decarboxylase [Pseudomonadota bacterium]
MKEIRGLYKKALDILPTALASRAFGLVSDVRLPENIQKFVNTAFVKLAGIDMNEAERPLQDYKSLNAVFTRKLRDGARTPADDLLVSPVDGRLSFFGETSKGMLIEAKGQKYDVRELIGALSDSGDDTAWLDDAYAFTIYLSPANYHGIHAPMTGDITRMSYAPGRLLPVNRLGYVLTDDLLPRNERLTSFIQDDHGHRCALVKVGATCVGRISVAYDDFKTNLTMTRMPFTKLLDPPFKAEKAEPLACFELGSTVVLLASKHGFHPSAELRDGQVIKVGMALGTWSQDI